MARAFSMPQLHPRSAQVVPCPVGSLTAMFKKAIYQIAALLMCLTVPAVAEMSDDADFKGAKYRFVGKTYRFDESKLHSPMDNFSIRFNKFIVYFDPDGTAYTWFPSKRVVAALTWEPPAKGLKLVNRNNELNAYFGGTAICLKNFPTKGKLCRNEAGLDVAVQEIANGDLLNLRSLDPPCRLCRADVKLSDIRKTVGGS